MGEQVQSPKQLTEPFEHHEKLEQGEPYIAWSGEVSKEAEKRVDCTPERLAKGADMLDFPASELNELAVLFRDQFSGRMQNVEFEHAVGMSDMSFKEGDVTQKFKHGIVIFVRDKNGELRTEEAINEDIFHELTHRAQHARGETTEASYINPKVQQRVRRAGQLAMGFPIATSVGIGIEGYKAAAAAHEVGKNILAAYEVAPHNTVAALVLGATAVGLTWGANYVKDKFPRRALGWLHKFDRRENEARSNETLAKKFSIVTVD